jgi:hypothetical protein
MGGFVVFAGAVCRESGKIRAWWRFSMWRAA